MLVVGPNGAGKTNLLESLHLGTQGFSPRTRNDAQLVRFGESAGRVCSAAAGRERPSTLEVTLEPGKGKRAKPERRSAARSRAPARGGVDARLHARPARDREGRAGGSPRVLRPGARAAVPCARRVVRPEYGAAVGQRNAALRRRRERALVRAAVDPWTEQVASLGTELVAARRHALELLTPAFARLTGAFGLGAGGSPTRGGRSVARSWTSDSRAISSVARRALGPASRRRRGPGRRSRPAERSAPRASSASRCSRCYSPRRTVLLERGGVPPLLLLDDVLSELDPDRRRTLAAPAPGGGQTLITSTTAGGAAARSRPAARGRPGEVRAA